MCVPTVLTQKYTHKYLSKILIRGGLAPLFYHPLGDTYVQYPRKRIYVLVNEIRDIMKNVDGRLAFIIIF